MKTSRRKFIQNAGTFSMAGLAMPAFAGNFAFQEISVEEVDIKSLFNSNCEEALNLTKRVFEKCILEKIMPPTPPLKYNWVVPGGPYYKGQWIWDTMFVVDMGFVYGIPRLLIKR